MGRPKEHDETTRDALLNEAEKLLARGGPDALSVRALADAVGTTTRAVYSLFGGKEGLVEQLAIRGYRLVTGYVAELRVTDDPASDLVNTALHGFRRFAIEKPHLFRLTFERVPAEIVDVPAVREASLAAYEMLAIRIRRAQAARVIVNRPVPEIAFAIHSLSVGLAGNELLRAPPPVGAHFWRMADAIDGAQLWRTALHALIRGLAPT